MMERFSGKKVLVVGLGRTGFSLINFFNQQECEIKVTDLKPIFDLNKAVKRLKRIKPVPEMTLGEHRDEDFLEADIVVYGPSIRPDMPQLELAKSVGKEVYSEFALAYSLCKKPIIAICSSYGRTTTAHMIGHCLKLDKKNSFVCGTSNTPFIELFSQQNIDEIDYVVLEASSQQIQTVPHFHPRVLIYGNIADKTNDGRFRTIGDYIETKLLPIKNLSHDDFLIVNFDALASNTLFRNANCQTYWYSRKSFVTLGVLNEVQGTHFHEKRIHCNIHFHSEFKVNSMRIIGHENRENLLAAITCAKSLKISDAAIQATIEKFPGIPNSLEFVMEKNGVRFYNDSKTEDMPALVRSLGAFKQPVILIAGGKDNEEEFEQYCDKLKDLVRVLVLVGESKERMNRALGHLCQTYLVGSFEESVLIAYQKSRTGDLIVLSPGNPSTDIFRDSEERGNYYKKLVYQL